MPLTRRSLFALLLAAPLAKWLPALPFTPRYYEVPVTLHLSDIDKIVLDIWMPRIREEYFKPDPMYALLKSHETLTFHGAPIEMNFYDPQERL